MNLLTYIHKTFLSLLWGEKSYYEIVKEDNETKERLLSRLYSLIKVNVTEEDLYKYVETHTLHRSPRSRSTVKIQCMFLETILKDPQKIKNVIDEIQGNKYNCVKTSQLPYREEFINVVHL